MFKDRTGEFYTFKDGRTMEIIKYFKAIDITVKFNDGTIVKNVRHGNFIRGNIKNLNNPNIHKIGFLGYGKYKFIKNDICYRTWTSLISRSYSNYTHSKSPSYIGCSVHPDWHNFQNFAKWFEENYVQGFHLDKDILLKGNKIYSAETCCFVPLEINGLFTNRKSKRGSCVIGVSKLNNKYISTFNINNKRKCLGVFDTEEQAFITYKLLKEKKIKELAEKHKSQITEQCYNALMNWQIEIND